MLLASVSGRERLMKKALDERVEDKIWIITASKGSQDRYAGPGAGKVVEG
jgi:hypothetical protein